MGRAAAGSVAAGTVVPGSAVAGVEQELFSLAIDATKWTSDWAIGREIAAAYDDARRDDLAIVCIGDPTKPSGFLVEPVGDELAQYHPNVFGTVADPVHEGNLHDQLAKHGPLWRSSFLLVIAPKGGLAEEIGLIVPSRAGWTPKDTGSLIPSAAQSAAGPTAGSTAGLGHLTLYATVFFEGMEDAGVPANPHLEQRARRAAHMLVDGVLRFFHKIEYDHTTFKPDRRPGL